MLARRAGRSPRSSLDGQFDFDDHVWCGYPLVGRRHPHEPSVADSEASRDFQCQGPPQGVLTSAGPSPQLTSLPDICLPGCPGPSTLR